MCVDISPTDPTYNTERQAYSIMDKKNDHVHLIINVYQMIDHCLKRLYTVTTFVTDISHLLGDIFTIKK